MPLICRKCHQEGHFARNCPVVITRSVLQQMRPPMIREEPTTGTGPVPMRVIQPPPRIPPNLLGAQVTLETGTQQA
jgi:hypothetical protein